MGKGEGASGQGGPSPRRSKGQRRLDRILAEIPGAREQLLVGIEDLGPDFNTAAIQSAMQSGDPHEKNKVAVIERELDVIVAYLDELARRGLAEGQRLEIVPKEKAHAMQRLADLKVIPRHTAERLQDVEDMRNQLAHAYPSVAWRSLHDAVETLLAELDQYTVNVGKWLKETGIA